MNTVPPAAPSATPGDLRPRQVTSARRMTHCLWHDRRMRQRVLLVLVLALGVGLALWSLQDDTNDTDATDSESADAGGEAATLQASARRPQPGAAASDAPPGAEAAAGGAPSGMPPALKRIAVGGRRKV